MRIRRIELNGFKSFMDRTTIDLPDGVTAIVGPNGCGKSNIVDAIRWVLGEQSPKHLRGESMEDVIFAGNGRLGPLGMAEVSLLLERSEEDLLQARTEDDQEAPSVSGLPPELAHASEVLVTRRYFRSGESEYFINRAPCRLRDITELFLGTGVGTKAYAIIEQGRVEQLVGAKPEELRLFIEEAAGTTRYRARRQSAERKMVRTQENLVRVQDVLREQQRQIASLERQARRAEEYHRLRSELRELDFRLAAAQQRQLLEQRHTLAVRLGFARAGERRCEAELAAVRAATGSARTARARAEGRLREIDEALTAAKVAAADAAARLETIQSRRLDAEERRRAAGTLAQAARDEETRLRAEVDAAERTLEEARLAVAEARQTEVAAQERLRGSQERRLALEEAIERAKDALVEAIGEETRVRNMVEALRARREEIAGRCRRLEEEQRLLGERLEANQTARGETQERLDALRARTETVEGERAKLAERRPALVTAVDTARERLERARAACTHLESRLASLRELQNRVEGCTRGAVSLLSRGEDHVLLADILRVPAALERAVAAALRTRLGDVVVETAADAAAAIRWLVEKNGGTATAIPRSPERPVPAIVPAGRRLLDEIEVDPAHWALAERLLGGVLLARDIDDALETWRATPHPTTVVTAAGEAVDPLGAITGGSEAPLEETLLSRRRELRALEADLADCRTVAERADGEFGEAVAALQALDEDYARCVETLQQLRLDRVAVEKDRDRLEEERARLAAELEVSALEVSGAIGADREVTNELAALQAAVDSAQAIVAERRAAVTAAGAALASWRDSVAADEEERTAAAVSRAAMEERCRAIERTLQGTRETLAETTRRACDQEALARKATEALHLLDDEAVQTRCAADEASAAIERLRRERDEVRVEVETLAAVLETDDARERAALDARESWRGRRAEWDVQLTETRLELEHLETRLRDRYDTLLAALPPAAEAGAPTQEELAQADALRAKLTRLGDVNPAAIDELREVQERYDFVRAQRDDLEKSLADLTHTIETLNRTCRKRFRDTFDAVNAKLGEVFPQLFPGGKARLELVEIDAGADDEAQEPGVEIVVQPAGKNLQSLTLLSGGEKALTATALVFSLFLIRPTPFCLLDEVDAPLDEANIGRFNQLVRAMARTSQFVVVTHNRRTMEGADTLYGITMEEAGVSKVVSVRLHEAA